MCVCGELVERYKTLKKKDRGRKRKEIDSWSGRERGCRGDKEKKRQREKEREK